MKYAAKITLMVFLLSFFYLRSAFTQTVGVAELVDQIKQSTEVQGAELIGQYKGKKLSGGGVVLDVKQYNAFDERTVKNQAYYEVITEVQKTAQGNPYQVVFFYKNKDDAAGINKEQKLNQKGIVLKIFDTRLWVAVWLYQGEYGPEEEVMFQESRQLPEIPKIN